MSAFHKRANMFVMPHAVPINNTQDWYWRMYDVPTYLRKPKPRFERKSSNVLQFEPAFLRRQAE